MPKHCAKILQPGIFFKFKKLKILKEFLLKKTSWVCNLSVHLIEESTVELKGRHPVLECVHTEKQNPPTCQGAAAFNTGSCKAIIKQSQLTLKILTLPS